MEPGAPAGPPGPGGGEARGLPRWAPWAAGAVALVVAVAVVVALTRPSGAPTYDDAARARFLDACTADGGAPVRPACACLYDRMAATVPYERFEQVSDELLAASRPPGAPLPLPPDLDELRAACVAQATGP